MPRNLIIPGKNALGSDYLKDAQTIEQWARQPIQQLLAGSGITLNPSNGLATDAKGTGPHPITISASGGGGGVTPGFFGIEAYPDLFSTLNEFYVPLSGADQTFGPQGTVSNFPIFPDNGNYMFFGINMFNVSWFVDAGAGFSVNILPTFDSCTYTSAGGHEIQVQYVYWAAKLDFSQYKLYTGNSPNIASFTTYQTHVADLSAVTSIGADLTLTAGTGTTGNGLVSTAGGPYMAGISGLILTSSDMLFP